MNLLLRAYIHVVLEFMKDNHKVRNFMIALE